MNIVWLLAVLLAAPAPQDDLARSFLNPPDSARPHTWWHWCNGNISKEGITADLEAMKNAGIGGAQIFNVDVGLPAGPVPFMSAKWREMIAHAVKEADRLGIEICVHNCAGWSSSGGPWIDPAHAMQRVVWSETAAHGPSRFDEVLKTPRIQHNYYRDIAVFAVKVPGSESGTGGTKLRIPDIQVKSAETDRTGGLTISYPSTPPGQAVPHNQIVNITSAMQPNGSLSWTVPAGDWTIIRFGHTPTGAVNAPAPGEGRGLECDKLSRDGLDLHWTGMLDTVLRESGPLAGKTFNNVLIDSYEVGSQNWTPRFREEFRKRRGYDLLPFLPAVTGRVVESVELTERFLWDFRRTIADLYAQNYYSYMAELCHKKGLLFSTEPYYSGMFDNLQIGGVPDIPMGEFWIGGGAMETTKLAASAGHVAGKRVIGAESFTADASVAKWLQDPYSIKVLGDQAFCNGINRYIFHRYAHQPWTGLYPGVTMGPWGTNFERTVTWWPRASSWLKYVARCQEMLQSGRYVADVCYFYGEGTPSSLPREWERRLGPLRGYSYDGCDSAALKKMTVRNGRIRLPDGMEYRLLVLPDSPFMTPGSLRVIANLVRAGATVVGPMPRKSLSLTDYPQCDSEVARLARDIWGNCDGVKVKSRQVGTGRIVWGEPLDQLLTSMRAVPDFQFQAPSKTTRLSYIHRSASGSEIYFVSNQGYRSADTVCSFRTAGLAPELWHPDTGLMEAAPVYTNKAGIVAVPIRFDPAGSVFVVFRHPSRGAHLVSVDRAGSSEVKPPPTRVEIVGAFYEPADGRPGADVTAKVAAMVERGDLTIPATNEAFGDPTPLVVKRLRVRYRLNGKPFERTVAENDSIELAPSVEDRSMPKFEVTASAARGTDLTTWQPGRYTIKHSDGGQTIIEARDAAKSLEVLGPWKVTFPPGWGAPESAVFPSLISWSDHDISGIKYFSGTAEYTRSMSVPSGIIAPGRAVILDLGRVKNIAEVVVNGKTVGVLWKAPFRIDVTEALKTGENLIAIKVTNLWPNRLIGDEQLPAEVQWNYNGAIKAWPNWLYGGRVRPPTGRVTFTSWHFYTKDSPLLESGLLGPVVIRSARRIRISP